MICQLSCRDERPPNLYVASTGVLVSFVKILTQRQGGKIYAENFGHVNEDEKKEQAKLQEDLNIYVRDERCCGSIVIKRDEYIICLTMYSKCLNCRITWYDRVGVASQPLLGAYCIRHYNQICSSRCRTLC